MRGLALAAIRLYQRYVSPYKGFCCAYRAHNGRASCSALGARVIRRHGLLAGGVLLRRRLRRCGDLHRQFHAQAPRPLTAQRGDCDLSCDLPGDGCDGCDGCDWPQRRGARAKSQPRRRRGGDGR